MSIQTTETTDDDEQTTTDRCPIDGCEERADAPAYVDHRTLLMCESHAIEAMTESLSDEEMAALAEVAP